MSEASNYRLMTPEDVALFDVIVELAICSLRQIAEAKRQRGSDVFMLGLVNSGEIGTRGYCRETSDVVTRVIQELGIEASREYGGGHYYTNLAPLGQLPSLDDPIICFTWGQFAKDLYSDGPGPFFGRRRDIMRMLPWCFAESFAPEQITSRQIIHRPDKQTDDGSHEWLDTEPADLLTGCYAIGGEPPADTDLPWDNVNCSSYAVNHRRHSTSR